MNFTLYNDDCLSALKKMDDNSIDSCVTDPPYGIAFMGKDWDNFSESKNVALGKKSPANEKSKEFPKRGKPIGGWSKEDKKAAYNFEKWTEDWSKEVFRVLKPGGFLLSFCSPRMYHRMACGIEDAGFDIRDQIMWLYGCLSEDTQIVTPQGKMSYTSIKPGDLVLCYDKYTKEYVYHPVEEVYVYDIKDTAYRIQSDHTDQIVSRNHRCLVERDGREVFVFAEELKTQENIPFLEDLSMLQRVLSNSYKGTGYKKQNLFKGLFQQTDWRKKFRESSFGKSHWLTTSGLLGLWDYILPKQKTFGKGEESHLFSSMQWNFAGGRLETTCPQGTKELEPRVGKSLGGKNDWGHKSELERWNNIQETQRELQGNEICSLSNRILEYGKERRLYTGTPSSSLSSNRQIVVEDRSGASYQSQSFGQSTRKFDAVCEQQRSQTIREWKGHKTTLATMTPFEYEGKVWCVKVPTGAFVAVRNGKAFTTGNSGFPKSHNIGKAIDKEFGTVYPKNTILGKNRSMSGANYTRHTIEIQNELAKQWEGWGTALKPAHEPIVVARKPISQTVAKNVLEYGTGALNIDGCRVGVDEIVDASQFRTMKRNKRDGNDGWGMTTVKGDEPQVLNPDGRWPANVIHDGSDEVVSQFPNAKGGTSNGDAPIGESGDITPMRRGKLISRNDSGSAARFFYSAKASKADRDEGNNHPTVKPTDLMRYLCRLVTPKGGVVLDPFMGSGSTGKAALLEGFKFVGIEREEEYYEIAQKRIEYVDNNRNSNLEEFFT
jgi:site-specific DNA-methyltransferase (adenine-specific)